MRDDTFPPEADKVLPDEDGNQERQRQQLLTLKM
jgi:hypothetical protein